MFSRVSRGVGLGILSLSAALVTASGCSEDTAPKDPAPTGFGTLGSLSAPSGKGSFRFGAASADTQIEDQNQRTDWWFFTDREEGLGKGAAAVGEASRGYSMAMEDIQLMVAMGLDSYRFSMSWARIEPVRDQIDEEALDHYSRFIDALLAAGIKPNVTLHHFSNPVWIDDPRDTGCANGPTSENLCGVGHPEGGPLVVEEMRQHAALLAARFGDRVDDWATLNEPVNYLLAAQGIGMFPPGKSKILSLLTAFIPVVRDFVSGHAAMYHAIKEHDTIDADGDGVAASVGLTLSVADWTPARDNQVSDLPVDVSAAARLDYVFHYLLVDALRSGVFDADLDGTPEEPQPSWKGTLDWLGVQYYFRSGVRGDGLIPAPLSLTPCFGSFDGGACLLPQDPTWCVPEMQYEYSPEGLYKVLAAFTERYPGLPLVVSESGIATSVGERRAANIVRALEQIERAQLGVGADVRGYYYWSLTDNFEWAEGFGPRFGLYSVDYTTYERTPTLGAEVLKRIIQTRQLSQELRSEYGGLGPMAPEASTGNARTLCSGRELP